MNVEIRTEAALFLEKEYISGIAVAVIVKQGCLVVSSCVCPRIPA
jgi:hypothetical protein